MAISISCSNCGRVVYASEKEAGKTKPCPGCGQSLAIPADPSLHTEKPTKKDCPQCGAKLHLVRQLHGKNVRCNKCRVVLAVSADPWRLSVVGRPSAISHGDRLEESQYLLPEGASPSAAQRADGQTSPLPPTMPHSIQEVRQLPNVHEDSIVTRTRPSSRADGEFVMFRCPSCSKVFQAKRHLAGKELTCSCGCNVQVPSLPSQPPLDAEPSFVEPPTILGLLSLIGVVTAVALVSSFLVTLLLGRS